MLAGGEVFRDSYGIPHLRAGTVDELAFVQGRYAAEDRAWQLEFQRWRSEGRTAEFTGVAGLGWDRFARQARLDDTARRCFDRLEQPTQRWLQAYVDGVNAGLPTGARLAAELRTLGVGPGRWSPWSPLGVFLAQHILFGTLGHKLWRSHVSRTLGRHAASLFGLEGSAAAGSNAWALSGARTASGAPMIAGDPHRTIEQPGVYQQVRLACPDFDVVGLAFPGVPGIAHFGHAGGVAWGVTNAMADYQDVFVEELGRDGDRVFAREAGGWGQVSRRHVERIAVRDGEPEEVEVIETVRGPVILELPGGRALSLRTPARVESDLGFGVLLPLLHARTSADVERAFAGWVEPVNSLLVADTTGSLSSLVVGRVPVRDRENQVRPVPAWDPRYAWSGAYADVGQRQVPDVAVNANDRASGGGLGYDYAPPHRAARIRALIGERTGLGADEMAAIHRDTAHSAVATLRRLLGAYAGSGPARRARDALLAWDGYAAADSTGMALFSQWRSALVVWLLDQPELAPIRQPSGFPDLYAARVAPEIRVAGAWERLVAADNPLGVDLAAGVAHALGKVAGEPTAGSWSEHHRLLPVHGLSALTGQPPALATSPLAGDVGCVCATHSTPGVSELSSFGPVARYVWDLSDRQASRWIVPLGASGAAAGPHRTDQLALWAAGEMIPVVTDWDRLTRQAP